MLSQPRAAGLALILTATAFTLRSAHGAAPATESSPTRPLPAKPTLYLIGDSTINNTANGALGWGAPAAIGTLFDPAKITIKNNARGGRSARSYYSEGLWDAVKNNLKPGDFVLMQFGTNDGGDVAGPVATAKGRPDLPGTGPETATAISSTGKPETVHTFGYYMNIYVADTQAKGATPIMLTMVPLDRFANGKVIRETDTFVKWAKEIAAQRNTYFIDLNDVTARRLDVEGADLVKTKYFTPPGDGTHTNPAGALLNAQSVVMGIKGLKGLPLANDLSDAGQKLDAADPADLVTPKPPATTQP